MLNLFLSFLIAISSAVGLVTLSKTLEMESYTSRIFPLIPLLYAISYRILERLRTGKGKQIPPEAVKPDKMQKDIKAGIMHIFRHITAGRILTAVGISFCIKLLFDAIFLYMFIYFNKVSFTDLYGSFSIDTIGRFLRGEHPWLAGDEGLYTLAVLALATSLGTGLWIGYTAKRGAIFEGVLAGAVVTVFNALTNMLILYQKIEEMANQMAQSMGYGMPVGFMAVLSLQVLLYGFWSGIAKKAKRGREERRTVKKLLKRAKKA